MNIVQVDTSVSLDALATRINEEHRACDEALREGLRHAVNAGELLIEAKSRCSHGMWGAWLEENFEGSNRTAQAYMRVARNRDAIDAKAQRVAGLSFRDALRELSTPRDEPREDPTPANPMQRAGAELVAGIYELVPEIEFSATGTANIPEDLPFETWLRVMELMTALVAISPPLGEADREVNNWTNEHGGF